MAVYTEVPDEELFAFLAGYDIGDLLSCKGIAEGVENTNYYLHTTQGSFILTLYEKRVNEADLPFFLGLMQHLAAKGLNCPLPVKNRVRKRSAALPAGPLPFHLSRRTRCSSAERAALRGSRIGLGATAPRWPRLPDGTTEFAVAEWLAAAFCASRGAGGSRFLRSRGTDPAGA